MKFTTGRPNPRFAKPLPVIVNVAGGLARSIVLGVMPLTPVTLVKLAVTACAALMVTLQVPVPAQLPLQPVKVEPAAGVAVSVTAVPLANVAEQVVPHEIPAGALVTVPVPAPVLLTVSEKLCSAKVAVTVVAAPSVTEHVPVPVQPPPLQPVKVEPAAGVAVSVTAVPLANVAEQVVPQAMPAGALVTVPVPAPLGLTVNVKVCSAKLAATVVAAPSVTEQVPVPAQPPPLQPVKVEPAAGAAVSVTAVPLANEAEHVVPQEMPAGALVTVPLPAPLRLTVSVKVGSAKVAVTVVALLSVTVHVPVPEQPPPLQPVNVEPAAGVAVNVTTVPFAYAAMHVEPHEMPAGLLVTVPIPEPVWLAVSGEAGTAQAAGTVVVAPRVTVHVPAPEPPPARPAALRSPAAPPSR